MPLTSCDNDDDPQETPPAEDPHNPTSDADQVAVKTFDALEYLQGCLVVVDKNGEVVRNVYGSVLDKSQPTVISVPAIDYAAAEATFLGWVAPGKKATKVEGGYDYQLTDAKGNAQGSVSFRAAKDEEGLVALMSVAPGTDLKQVSEVRFIDSDSWPENFNYSKYVKGEVKNGRLTELLREYGNLYCDISAGSGANALMRDRDHAARFIEEFADRIYYGCDICMHNQQFPFDFDEFLTSMRESGEISDENYRKIVRGNAEKLLGI
jgi:hypothetical protein